MICLFLFEKHVFGLHEFSHLRMNHTEMFVQEVHQGLRELLEVGFLGLFNDDLIDLLELFKDLDLERFKVIPD